MDQNGNLNSMGAVQLARCKSIYDKADKLEKFFYELTNKVDITHVYVEENLQAFRPGFSSAKTILSLAKFNGIACLLAKKQFSTTPINLNVNAARKTIELKIKRGDKKNNTKQQVFEWVNNKTAYDWPTKKLKSGPRKGIIVLEDFVYDMADAYVIALAGHKMNNCT